MTVLCLLAAVVAVAANWFLANGYVLYFGDAQAHLNIARRILDSRTPGYHQIGTVWLPLPHLLMLPLVSNGEWWRTGLAGAIPSAGCFVLAGLFLFGAARTAFSSPAAGFVAAALFALNPNVLYLSSTPMTEPVWFASLSALLFFTVLYGRNGSVWWAAAAGVANLAATLTRYEGWFLIPFVAAYLLAAGRHRRVLSAAVFCILAAAGPLWWLAHNWWGYGDALEFYHGPYSAKAIYQQQLRAGMARYPGDGEWDKAFLYFREAARLCLGLPLAVLGIAGIAAAAVRRVFWPLLLLALPAAFYVWSMVSSGTPIFVPHLWPNSYYNTRYGLAALPLAVFGAAALTALAPQRWRFLGGALVVAVAVAPWIAYPRSEGWVCWKESQVNSEARREWTREAAGFLKANAGPQDGILTSFGDLTGIFGLAGIPLRQTLHEGNIPYWEGTVLRPDLWLSERWVVAMSGDKAATAVLRAGRRGPHYRKVRSIYVKGAPVIEIYRRDYGQNPIYQGPRGPE